MNLLAGRYAGAGSPLLQCEGFELPIGQGIASVLPAGATKVVVGLRPEALEVRPTAAPGTIPGTVETVHFQGDQSLCVVHVGSVEHHPGPCVIANLVICMVLLIFLAPVLWMLITAVKPPGKWLTSPPVFVPSELHWKNFTDALFKWNGLKGLIDSLIVAVGSTVLELTEASSRGDHVWPSLCAMTENLDRSNQDASDS